MKMVTLVFGSDFQINAEQGTMEQQLASIDKVNIYISNDPKQTEIWKIDSQKSAK